MAEQNRISTGRHASGDSDRGLLVIVLVIFTAAGTGIFSCGGFLVWQFLRPVDTPVADVQSPDEKRAELRAAFSALDVGVPAAELRELVDLFDRFTTAANNGDESAFQRLIHPERLHEEMHRSGLMPEQLRVFDLILQDSLAEQLWLPIYATRHHIVHVSRIADSEDAVVYAHFWYGQDDPTEMRVWVTRDRGRWEIFDWEILQYGMRASHEMALYQASDTATYDAFFNQLNRSQRLFDNGNDEAGVARLRECEALLSEIPDLLREQTRMHIVTCWMTYGYYDEAAELGRRAVSPSENPGTLYAQILFHNYEGEHEQVLELCDRYEDAIGSGPNVARYRAEAFAGLDRDVEANVARAEYLRWDTDNIEILAEFALNLAPDDKSRIHAFLTRASEPMDACQTLAERFSRHGDQAGLLAILSHLEHQESTAAEMDYVNGLILELRGEDTAAADLFLAALEQQSDKSENWNVFWRFCECQTRLGDVLRAYELSPDPDAAFAYLANGDYDEGGDSPLPPDVLWELALAHRDRSPQDPWWAYHLGNLYCRDDEFDKAESLYRIGLHLLPDDDEHADASWALETRLSECLVAAGRWRDAYERGDSPTESFATLAGELFWREQDDILRELIQLHQSLHPDDVMGWLYAGRLALKERHFDAAESFLDEAWSRHDPEDAHEYQIRAARVELCIAAGRALEAYGDVPPDEETFSQLARHFLEKHEYDSLEDLIKLRRQDAPDDAILHYFQIKARFQQDNYTGVLETIGGLPPDFVESLESFRRSDWDFMHLRSLLRTGRSSEAIDLARDISSRQSDMRALIVALCCSNQHQEALDLLRDSDDYPYNLIYNDPDAGPILRSESFQSVRELSPPRIQDPSIRPIVMLLDRPRSLSVEELSPVVDRVFGPDARIDPLRNLDDSETSAYVVSTDESEFLVAAGEGRYQEDLSQLRAGLFADARRWEAVAGHRAWCAVSLIDGTDGERLASQQLTNLRHFAGEFIGEDCVGLYDGAAGRILVPSDGLPDLLLAPDPGDELSAAGESLWMYRVTGDFERDMILQERIQRLLHGTVYQWTASPDEHTLDVVARLSAEPAGELIRIRVESIKRGSYSGWVLSGRLTDDSQLVPWLHSGDPIRIDSWSVVDWTLTTATETSNARAEAEQWWEQTRGGDSPTKDSSSAVSEKLSLESVKHQLPGIVPPLEPAE